MTLTAVMGAVILPLQCGCAADAERLGACSVTRLLDVVSCPWCGSTFSMRDLGEWLEAGQPLAVGGAPPPLMRFGGSVLEHCGHCDCGALVVREGCAGVRFSFGGTGGDG